MAFNSLNKNVFSQESGNLFLYGIVVDNNDPQGLDRIKVRIPELYDPDKGEVPWCLPIKYSPFGQGSGWGVYGVPAIGSTVCIQIQQNNFEYPVYIGTLLRNPGEGFGSPDVWGFKDPSGNSLHVNTKTQSWDFYQSSGISLHMENGNYSLKINGKCDINIGNDCNVIAGNNCNVKANSVKVDSPISEFTGVVKAPTINATNSLTVAGIEMKTHVHGGVDRGNSSTDGPH